MLLLRFVVSACASLLIVANTGCKSDTATMSPGAQSHAYSSFYVAQREDGGMHQVIADELNLLGKHASTGPESSMPSTTDVLVTFNPKWQWDITMYLLELQMEFRDPRDKTVLVSARAYRPSLQRASGSQVTRQLLEKMFATLSGETPNESSTAATH